MKLSNAAEIYPVRSSLQMDPTKRGGRWQSDFIWNSNWKEALDFEESMKRRQEENKNASANQANNSDGDKGFLSLTSKVDLNSMDVDLSSQLRPRPKTPSQASSPSRSATRINSTAGFPSIPPTRGEVRNWDRGGRYSKKVVATTSSLSQEEELEQIRQAELEAYQDLKKELQLYAAGLTALCLTATYLVYGRDIAASYGIGALAGLFYLRLLNRSVDGFGGFGGIGGALGQQRLLIPVILALGYNRYNTLMSENTGLTLQLLPMLVGFFTYKGAVVARQSLVLFSDLTAPYKAVAMDGDDETSSRDSHS